MNRATPSATVLLAAGLAAVCLPSAHADGPDGLTPHELELLERYKPILVILPQDPQRRSPGSWTASSAGRGDYHPQAVEDFIQRATLGEEPRGRLARARAMYRTVVPGAWRGSEPSGAETILDEIRTRPREDLERTVLELGETSSNDRRGNWEAHRRWLRAGSNSSKPAVTYGNVVDGPNGERYLQYWLFYSYNDFRNKHEGDFEAVTVRLDRDGRADRLGLSAHHGGSQVAWDLLTPVGSTPTDKPVGWRRGDRPVVYVARGSHANYGTFKPRGHRLVKLKTHGLPAWVVNKIQDLPLLEVLSRDRPPPAPESSGIDPGAREQRGIFLTDLQIRTLDSLILRFPGYFGSRNPALFGSLGVPGPWNDDRWRKPHLFFQQALDLGDMRGRLVRLSEATRASVAKVLARIRNRGRRGGPPATEARSEDRERSGMLGVLGEVGGPASRRAGSRTTRRGARR